MCFNLWDIFYFYSLIEDIDWTSISMLKAFNLLPPKHPHGLILQTLYSLVIKLRLDLLFQRVASDSLNLHAVFVFLNVVPVDHSEFFTILL